MPYTKEQLKEYYLKRKAELNRKGTERRKLARLGHLRVETINKSTRVETAEKVETANQVEPKLVQIFPQPNGTTKIIFANLQVCLDWINKH